MADANPALFGFTCAASGFCFKISAFLNLSFLKPKGSFLVRFPHVSVSITCSPSVFLLFSLTLGDMTKETKTGTEGLHRLRAVLATSQGIPGWDISEHVYTVGVPIQVSDPTRFLHGHWRADLSHPAVLLSLTVTPALVWINAAVETLLTATRDQGDLLRGGPLRASQTNSILPCIFHLLL